MPVYGKFETLHELGRTAVATVYAARSANAEGPPTVVIKEYAAGTALGGSADRAGEGSGSGEGGCGRGADRIRRQATAARGLPAAVVPILDEGRTDASVWCAMPYYGRSLERLVEGKVRLSVDALCHVLLSIVRGAQGLKRADGRPHGNLKLSNVFLTGGTGAVGVGTTVLLADPDASGEAKAAELELSDLRAVGRLIYELVVREATQRGGALWPVSPGSDWGERFGHRAADWIELCNGLLDPALDPAALSLEELERRLVALQPRRRPWGRMAAIGAGLLAVGIGAAYLIVHWRGQGTLSLASDPPHAEVLIEGRKVAETPAELRLRQGVYALEARSGEFTPLIRQVNVEPGKVTRVDFRFVYGTAVVEATSPTNALILDAQDRLLATGRYVTPKLPPGTALTFAVRPPPGAPFVEKFLRVQIQPTQQVHVVALDRADPRWARVRILSDPPELAVYAADRTNRLFETPWRDQYLAGQHRFYALPAHWPRAAGQEFTVTVEPAQVNTDFSVNVALPHGRLELGIEPGPAQVIAMGTHGTNVVGTSGARGLSQTWPPGRYALAIAAPGFKTHRIEDVVLQAGGTFTTNVTLVPLGAVVRLTANLEATRVRVLELTNPPIRVGPDGASVTLLQGTNAEARYTLVAEYDALGDLPPQTNVLRVRAGLDLAWNIHFEHGVLQLSTDPPEAAITVNGAPLAARPPRYLQRPGLTYRYRVAATNYQPADLEVALKPGEQRTNHLALARALERVVIPTEPAGLTLLSLDRQPLRPDPGVSGGYLLPWGTNSLIAEFEGLPARTSSFVVNLGRPTTNRVRLPHGVVSFNFGRASLRISDPARGRTLGVSPTNLVLPPGTHRLELDLPRRGPTNLLVTVEDGRTFVVEPGIVPLEFPDRYTNTVGPSEFVRLPGQDLYVGTSEVLVGAYYAALRQPAPANENPLMPVTRVSLADALKFCAALTALDRPHLDAEGLDGWEYTLPSYDEWTSLAPTGEGMEEATLRGGLSSGTALMFDPSRQSRNRLGVYDAFGNVAELCYRPGTGGQKEWLAIGGSYLSSPGSLPAIEVISGNSKETRGARDLGFRCVLKPVETR